MGEQVGGPTGARVGWLTGFLDVPGDRFGVATTFWTAATGTTLSPLRGERGQFASLLPPDGDACWRVQGLEAGGPSLHLDLHTADRPGLVGDAVARGATVHDEQDDLTVLHSPGGLPLCVVVGDESRRGGPVDWVGHTAQLDQVCLDVPTQLLEAEIDFWSGVLDSRPSRSTRRAEFTNLRRPAHLPLRLLFQDVGPGPGPASAHPDLASTDRPAEAARLEALGAEVLTVEDFWTVLRAPDERLFCVTERDPATGQLN